MPRVGKSYIGCVPLKIVKDIQKSLSVLRIVVFFLCRFQFPNIWSRKQVSVLVSEKKVLLSKNLVSEKNPDQNFCVVTQLTQKSVYILLGSINWAAE